MPKHKAPDHLTAQKLVQLMANHGAWAQVQRDHVTVEYASVNAWKRVMAQWKQMQTIRQAAESRSMMETKELI